MPKVSVIVSIDNQAKELDQTLESLRSQSFRDVEVIAVENGASEENRSIIQKYCEEDKRFSCIHLEETGVCAARNAGLDQADGEFVLFAEAGDTMPERALTDLHGAAKKQFADMIVGLSETEQIDGVHVPEYLTEITSKTEIDKFDPALHQVTDIWGKLFRREVIENDAVRFPEFVHMADAVFVYRFSQRCRSMAGCSIPVYKHIERADFTDPALKEIIGPETVKEYFTAFDMIEETVEASYADAETRRLAEGAPDNEMDELACRYRLFREDMYVRFVQDRLLGDLYRRLWRLDSESLQAIEEKIRTYRSRIFPSNWEKTIDGLNGDLAIHKKIMTSPEELAEEPILSVVISSKVAPDMADALVTSLYNQNFPSFETVVDETLSDSINETWKSKINYSEVEHIDNLSHFIRDTVKVLRGRYVIFVDETVLFPEHLIKEMYEGVISKPRNLENHFVSVPLRRLTEHGSIPIEANSTPFINELDKIRLRSIYNQLDYFWCNKMFSVVYLRGKKVLSRGDAVTDIAKLYNNSNYTKLSHLAQITTAGEKDSLSRVSNPWVKWNYRRKIRQDEKIKEYIAKQDIRITTKAQKLKNWRLQRMRFAFRFLTRKILYPLCYRWYARKPVDEKKVIFIEPRLDKLTNSIMEIYDYFKESGEYTIHEHYLRDRYARYRVQYKRSMDFIKDFATAKYAVVAEANNTLGCLPKRRETIVCNTWHGCGAFKRFGFSTADKIFGGSMKEKLKYPLYKNLDIVTVSSPEAVWAFEEAMGLEGKGVVQPLGVSRTDVFFDEDYIKASVDRVHEAVPASKDKKIIFYAPTFRGRIATAVGPDALDVDRMARELSDEYVLIIKHHPLVKRPPLLSPDIKDVFAFDLTRNGSIDDLICASDICISDYSSLVFEYSLFERPMIFFAYDLDDYFDWRGFYYDYEELTPGPIVTGTEEIIHYIKNIDTLFDRQQVIDFRQRFMSCCDGHATERIIKKMKEMGAS